ncbi:MAG TPA: signal peptidase I [Nitrospirota bacterium]|nr:signal peptidase I [Nitrospirota bacterium]
MAEEAQQEPRLKKSFYKEWVEPFLIAAVIALFIRQFIVEAFKIPSGSMIPTLTIGDHLLVNKFVYGPRIPFTDKRLFSGENPKRGEIIVFKYPENEDKNFIKRVVGVPGDKIQIVKGKLFINDQPVAIVPVDQDHAKTEPGMFYDSPSVYDELLGAVRHRVQYLMDQSRKNFGPRLVPEDSVFVMGDNRDNSQDSRVWGFVKFEKILGRAFIIYWSWDGEDRWVRWDRIGSLIH